MTKRCVYCQRRARLVEVPEEGGSMTLQCEDRISCIILQLENGLVGKRDMVDALERLLELHRSMIKRDEDQIWELRAVQVINDERNAS